MLLHIPNVLSTDEVAYFRDKPAVSLPSAQPALASRWRNSATCSAFNTFGTCSSMADSGVGPRRRGRALGDQNW